MIYINAIEGDKNNPATSAVLGSGVEDFILRFKNQRAFKVLEPKDRIYRTKFENLILNPEIEIRKLEDFLEVQIDKSVIENFDFNKSLKNINKWMSKSDKNLRSDLRLIEEELETYIIEQ
ncbi:sulfotransferase [bacterium]|nr:sulfotransferase [bacterium]